ncbi:hypothetical protein [Sphingobium sp. B11D3A]|uniref:hypothetical protein n=1 Tax=Sphingobium sp. B11D3A TaxID=2940574 RepID=UPI0022242495|nr:hypothetical protein [Sphingobium sp. B11D3A]MCW2391955.1 hypothetical protein [Sphingobium sp. B11D3A]
MPNESLDEIAAFGIGNLSFYRMCSDFRTHENFDRVSNKLIFISRVYSVARGLGGRWEEISNAIVSKSGEIDEMISAVSQYEFLENVDEVVRCHQYLDDIVCNTLREFEVNSVQRASFSSKYLHFHAPDSFPLLDSLAKTGLASLTQGFRTKLKSPKPYARFCERLEYFMTEQKLEGTSLRHIDTFLVDKGRSARAKASYT